MGYKNKSENDEDEPYNPSPSYSNDPLDSGENFCYSNTTWTTNLDEMEKNMIFCLDDVPLLQIIWYGI